MFLSLSHKSHYGINVFIYVFPKNIMLFLFGYIIFVIIAPHMKHLSLSYTQKSQNLILYLQVSARRMSHLEWEVLEGFQMIHSTHATQNCSALEMPLFAMCWRAMTGVSIGQPSIPHFHWLSRALMIGRWSCGEWMIARWVEREEMIVTHSPWAWTFLRWEKCYRPW